MFMKYEIFPSSVTCTGFPRVKRCFLIRLLVYACTSFSDLARAPSNGVILTPRHQESTPGSDDSDIESGTEALQNLK